jgi:transcription initiation factor IIE alpha subunit
MATVFVCENSRCPEYLVAYDSEITCPKCGNKRRARLTKLKEMDARGLKGKRLSESELER